MSTAEEAWAEAQTASSPDVVEVYSIEMWHPSFSAPVRAVNDTQDHILPIEATAPRDAGATVPFTAIPFRVPWQQQQDGQVGTLDIQVDNIGREVMPYLDDAIRVSAALQIIFRCHLWHQADGSITEGMDAITVDLRQVTVNDTVVSGTASLADLVNLQMCRVVYDVVNYAALVQ